MRLKKPKIFKFYAGLLCFAFGLPSAVSAAPDAPFGANVVLFRPDMPEAAIQKIADDIYARQLDNQFGAERYALLFEPGAYGSKDNPLRIKVGYYTEVAGLGAKPTDVVVHGVIQVRNRCFKGGCVALDNFWRSLSNLHIDVPPGQAECDGEIWAVSQAAPVRRIKVSGGDFRLTDKCSAPAFASGGFIADSVFGGDVQNGVQQQFLTRNSRLAHWVGGNWNQVFVGVEGSLPSCSAGENCPYFAVAQTSESKEAPFLYKSGTGGYEVFRPGLRLVSSGVSWEKGTEKGDSLPLHRFFLAAPKDGARTINAALDSGRHLILTPGVYHLTEPLRVSTRGTVILGLGFPTLIPDRGGLALKVRAPGVSISGVLFEAGKSESPELVRIGERRDAGDAADPSALHDVFFRVGGAEIGKAAASLVVNQSHVILDHLWAWRADHGQSADHEQGVGWDKNVADTGLIVRGDHVTAYGLFVEHYQKDEVVWEGEEGTVIFLQNEMPYDAPNQQSWRASADHDGYPAFKVADGVRHFRGMAFGSYNYFNRGVAVFADDAFEVPATLPPGSLKDAFTIFLNAAASGGVRHVVNRHGGSATAKNPDIAVRIAAYP
ncbi:MAG TPA: coagulation factor 5/8 type domain-containing protein [Steroidobacteraceae bacterium]|jgi:hypothetical protein